MRLGGLLIAALLAACSSNVVGSAADDVPDARGAEPQGVCDDTSSDPMNCGACDRVCVISSATAGCELGECTIAACPSGYTDADGDIANGCELAPGDEAGPLVCREDKSELCNAFDDNCNGQCDEGRADGCRQGVHRGAGGGHHIFSSVLSDVQTAPYAVEAQDFFYTYSAPGCDSVPLYRLYQGASNNHFYTTSVAERDNATANLGYVFEFVAGYVFVAR